MSGHSLIHLLICHQYVLLSNNDRTVVTETIRPAKLKVFTIWSFTEKKKATLNCLAAFCLASLQLILQTTTGVISPKLTYEFPKSTKSRKLQSKCNRLF